MPKQEELENEMKARQMAAARAFAELRITHGEEVNDYRILNRIHALPYGIDCTMDDVEAGRILIAEQDEVAPLLTYTRRQIADTLDKSLSADDVTRLLAECPVEVSKARLDKKIGKAEFWEVDLDALKAWYQAQQA